MTSGVVKRFRDLADAAALSDTDVEVSHQDTVNLDAEPVKNTLAVKWAWIVAKITANAASIRTALGLASVATSGSASDLTTGTLPAARMPVPSSTTLGGVQSKAAVTHQFLTSISTAGVPTLAQPAVADVTGAAASGANSDITSLTGLTAKVSWTPTVTFATPGDLTVSYATQVGWTYQVGKLVYVYVSIVFTPTYTTASGILRIVGLTPAPDTAALNGLVVPQYSPAAFPGGTGTYLDGQVLVISGTTYIEVFGEKTTAVPVAASAAQVLTGVAQTITLAGVYLAA